MGKWIKLVPLLIVAGLLSGCRSDPVREAALIHLSARFPGDGIAWELAETVQMHVWQATYQDITFLVGVDEETGPWDSYDRELGLTLLGELDWENTFRLHVAQDAPQDSLWLEGEYTDRAGLVSAVEGVERLYDTVEKWENQVPVTVRLHFRQDQTIYGGLRPYTLIRSRADLDVEALERDYAEFLLAHCDEQTGEFSDLELGVYRRESARMVKLENAGGDRMACGSVIVQPDGEVTFAGLYHLAELVGLEPEGGPRAFSFTGVNGRVYGFSYGYCSRTEEGPGAYYCMRDGEQVVLGAYTASVSSEWVWEMMGWRVVVLLETGD